MHIVFGGIQCENTQFKLPQISPTHMIPGINGDTIHVNSVADFWTGGVDQRIFCQSTATSLKEPKKTISHRGPLGVRAVQP